jgi:hypothetical protein
LPLIESLTIGGRQLVTEGLPPALSIDAALGLVTAQAVSGSVVHTARWPERGLYECRATPTPGGEWLLMFPDGGHYGQTDRKVNDMLAYRSSDRGQTWRGPTVTFDIDYNQHGFVPLIPRGGTRIYAFGTQPVWGMYTRERGLAENAPIGFRYSDDDGHSWSEVRLIRPVNDPSFTGMSVMRMCETASGAWLIGAHEGDWSYKPLMTRQYILRSEDQGATWELLPGPRHGGWCCLQYGRMDELRPVHLGGGRVLALARTPEGHLWELRSEDDGKTWSPPAPTCLVHPDAPPMIFPLGDGKTLAAFHHNRHSVTPAQYGGLGSNPEAFMDRSEVWVSLSSDDGRSWTEPRFVFANALAPSFENPWRNYNCSYIDAFSDGGELQIFVPHRWERVLHLRLPEASLPSLPTREELCAN